MVLAREVADCIQSVEPHHRHEDNGTTVQFIAYPTAGHFPPDPVHQRDVYKRWIEWIAKYFGQTPWRADSLTV